jgi:hypothetical protein
MRRLLHHTVILTLILGLPAVDEARRPVASGAADDGRAAPEAPPAPALADMRVVLRDGRVVVGPFNPETNTMSGRKLDAVWCEPAGAEYGADGKTPELPAGLDRTAQAKAQEIRGRIGNRRVSIQQAIKDRERATANRIAQGKHIDKFWSLPLLWEIIPMDAKLRVAMKDYGGGFSVTDSNQARNAEAWDVFQSKRRAEAKAELEVVKAKQRLADDEKALAALIDQLAGK